MMAIEVIDIAVRLNVRVTDDFSVLDYQEWINFSKFLDCDIYVKIIRQPKLLFDFHRNSGC